MPLLILLIGLFVVTPAGFCSEPPLRAGAAAYPITPVDQKGRLWQEPYQDSNNNGRYDAPDPANPSHPHDSFTDENGNGKWDGPYLAGFHHKASYYTATGVHDPIWARALILDQGQTRIGFLALDLVGLFHPQVEEIRRRVADLRLTHLIVASTHTHGGLDSLGLWGPNRLTDGKDPRFMDHLLKQSERALRKADRQLTAARVTFTAVEPTHTFGPLINDLRDPIVIDSGIVVMAVDDHRGRAIATVVNWTPHPETMGGSDSLITSDFPHYVRLGIEKGGFQVDGKSWRGRGGVTLYFSGTLGGLLSTLRLKIKDEQGNIIPQRSWAITKRIGEIVAASVLESLKGKKAATIEKIRISKKLLFIPLDNPIFRDLIAHGVLQRETYTQGVKVGVAGEGNPVGADLLTEVGVVSFLQSGQPIAQFVTIPGEIFPEIAIGGYLGDTKECWETRSRKLALDGIGKERVAAAHPHLPTEPVIKQKMSAPYKFIIGLANDEIGYIVPANDFVPPVLSPTPSYGVDRCGDHDHYEETMSVGPQTAPILSEAIVELLEAHRGH